MASRYSNLKFIRDIDVDNQLGTHIHISLLILSIYAMCICVAIS